MNWEPWVIAWAAAWLALLWVLYPMGTILLASILGQRVRPSIGPLPRLSVVIATRDAADLVAQKVRNLLACHYPRELLEIIVVYDRQAALPSPLCDVPRGAVRLLEGDEPGGKASTLNAGVREARGELVVLTDTHQLLTSSALEDLARAFTDDSIGAVSGFLELRPGTSLTPMDVYWRIERELRRAEGELDSSVGVTGALYAIRRSLWPTLPAGLILDDVFVPMSVVLGGRRVIVEPRAVAREQRISSPAVEFGRKARTLAGNIQMVRWMPGLLDPRRNRLWLQFLFHKLLRLTTPFVILLLGLSLVSVLLRVDWPSIPAAVLAGAAVAAALLFSWRGGREVVRWFLALQMATLVGVYYGVRRRWNVWR